MANKKISELISESAVIGSYELPMIKPSDVTNYKVQVSDLSKGLDAALIPVSGFSSPNLQGALDELASLTQGALLLQGDWDADTNTPDITGTTETGFAWRVSVAGNASLGGISDWKTGDLAVKVDTGWIKVDNQDVAAVWGNISGSLANQADLQAALDAKFSKAGGNVAGDVNISDSLTVDTDTLYVDAATKRVGVRTSTPAVGLDVVGGMNVDSRIRVTGDGSAAAPSIQPGLDGDTGMFRPAANTIGLSTAGVERVRIDSSGTLALNAANFREWLGIESVALGENGAHIAYASSGSVFISMGAYFDGASFVRDGDGAVQVALLQRNGTTQFFSAPAGLDGELLSLTPTLSFGVSSFTYNGLNVLLDTGIPETDPDNFFATTFPETISTTSSYDASPVTAIDADKNITATGAFEVTATGLINTDATNRRGTVQLFVDDVPVHPSEVEIEPKDADNYYSFTIKKTDTLNVGLRNFKLKYGRRGGGGGDPVTMVGGEITVRRLV